jgi:hypothetical protein
MPCRGRCCNVFRKAYFSDITGNVEGDGSCFYRAIINFCIANDNKWLLEKFLRALRPDETDQTCLSNILHSHQLQSVPDFKGIYHTSAEGDYDVEDTIVLCIRSSLSRLILRGESVYTRIFEALKEFPEELEAKCEHLEDYVCSAFQTAMETTDDVQEQLRFYLLLMSEHVLEMTSYASQPEVETLQALFENLKLNIFVSQGEMIDALEWGKVRPLSIYLLQSGDHYRFFKIPAMS